MSKKNNPPQLKSVAKVKGQVSQYVSSNETKKLVKEAILKELNSHLLSIKPEKIHHHESPNQKASAAWKGSNKPLGTKQSGKDIHGPQDSKPMVERHGLQVSSVMSSKIPRPLKPIKKKDTTEKKDEQIRIQLYQNLPNYEWHKYGRIDELKFRFLARKFSSIWVRNVFGRVPPQKARRFYEQKLMKNVFSVLEESWWKTRKGWKLNIRAEYHNRYRLWKSCFRAWRSYTCMKKEKRHKYLLAANHDESIVLKKCLVTLVKYHMYRSAKRKKKEKADAFRVIKSQRFVIQCWKRALSQSEVNKALEREALSWWAVNLISKAFGRWKLRKAVVDVENKNIAFAVRYYNRVKLKQCFRVLISYAYIRRKKLLMKEFANNHYFERLKKRVIAKWYLQLQHKLDVVELQDRIEFMSRKFILRTFFIRWQFFELVDRLAQLVDCLDKNEDIKMCNDNKDNEFLATVHCHQKLKAKYLHLLFRAANLRKLKKERELLAFEFRKKTVLYQAWEIWLMRCDRSEELKMYPLTKIARSFQRKKALKKFFAEWCRYIIWRRKRKQLYAVADEHFKNSALPKFFGILYEYKEKRLEKIQRVLEANAFHRELMFAKYFYTWLKQSRLKQEFRLQERIAILHHEEISKRKMLLKWRKATGSLLEEQRKEALADAHYKFILKDKYFTLLTAHCVDEITQRKQERIAVVHYAAKRQNIVFASWKMYTLKKRMKRRRLNVAVSHYHNFLAAKAMYALKVYLAERREIRDKVEERVKFYNQQLLGKVFRKWHQNVFDLLEERRTYEAAQNYANQRKMAKVFEAWRNHTAVSLHIQSEENAKVLEVRTALERGKLQRAFSVMKEFQDYCRRRKKLKESASILHENRLKTKYFELWKNYRRFAFQKLLLQRNSEVFYVKVRMFHFFHKWRAQQKIAIHERNRSNVVLWLWSKNVKRKMFSAWKDYLRLRKRKKIRHTKALELRREFLLESCLQNWLRYSSDMIAFRTKMARHRQLEEAEKLHERVRRYALTWYNRTQKGQDKVSKEKNEEDYVETISGFQKMPTYGGSADEGSQAIFGKRNLMQTIPIVNKDHRLQPRKPAYLRDSFDLTELMETGAQGTNVQVDVSRDESRPRGSPPRPSVQARLQGAPPPLDIAENAIKFATSSDEDLPASKTMRSPHRAQGIRIDKKRRVVLMPPSSFKKSPIAQISEIKGTGKQDKENSALDMECSPRLPDDYDNNASDAAESEGSNSDYESTQIFQEILKIKEELECYRKKQNYLRELKKRLLHVSSWLSSEGMLHNETELKHDIDFIQAAELKCQIENEIDLITVELNAKKPAVRNIATHVETLAESLQM